MSRGSARWDADSLLSRGLSALLLVTYVVAIYSVVTLASALAFGEVPDRDFRPVWWLNVIPLAVLLITALPVYRWLRRGVNQLVYGQHDDPYGVLTRLNQPLAVPTSPATLLPTLAQTVAATLRLPYVAIETQASSGPLVAEHGRPLPGLDLLSIPLHYDDVILGRLLVSPRRRDEALSATDIGLLRDLARQVGITMQTARLNEELQASRERLVTAREEERRRIRRDLHDGLGPMLSALRLQSGAMRRIIRENPAQAEALADELRRDLQIATAEIRRLVYGLRPPLLDDLGLAGALRALDVGESGPQLIVEVPDPLPPLPAAVEVAVYRIAAEAVNNVVKHAQASHASIALNIADHVVTLSVADDGVGLAAQATTGVGLVSMRERAEELGGRVTITSKPDGGTQVVASIPWSKVVPHGEANGPDRG